jgi:predicted GH43/DUF377 family glycosyl hydrolase
MTTTTRPLARLTTHQLRPDPTRVIAQLFLPGEELHRAQSRAGQIVARVMHLDYAEIEVLASDLVDGFAARHHDYEALLARHAQIVAAHVGALPSGDGTELSRARTLVLGAAFTAEYATEAAALCNPSAVQHPDQSGLAPGRTRLAISVRGIGEGHKSSIGFCEAVVGPGEQWEFEPRVRPVTGGEISSARWRRAHLRVVLADQGTVDELGGAVLRALPTQFDAADLEHALAGVHHDLLMRPGAVATAELLRKLVASAYTAEFDVDSKLTQRVLLPAAGEESHGMEDARFTRFVEDDGVVDYRATYTAYDGYRIAPRLLTSRDLRVFQADRLAGPAARNKGMALFPRRVDGRYLALCRSDGESTSLSTSADGFTWNQPVLVQQPQASWELLQIGNCGPPIETERGWLVLTHGVGPMRSYAIGAILLDLDQPEKLIARLEQPLLEPSREGRDGYVPNVVYSCGGVVHDGTLWLPHGISDTRIGVASVSLDDLFAAMTRV